jgi:hypothetical protein
MGCEVGEREGQRAYQERKETGEAICCSKISSSVAAPNKPFAFRKSGAAAAKDV